MIFRLSQNIQLIGVLRDQLMKSKYLILTVLIFLFATCRNNKENGTDREKPVEKVVQVPLFNGDSAYSYVKKQVDFGPRIPNTNAHRATSQYLIKKLKDFGATVTEQSFEAKSYDGQHLVLKNIIGSFYPDKQKRILLAAHWDTRPFADKDKEKPNASFDGANDGASGVGILVEIARILKTKSPDVGVDIIFFDGEDWGERIDDNSRHALPEGQLDWWCLGSQYWASHKHKANYSAYYGILLDMVGSTGAKFYREEGSLEYAPSIVEKVWNSAARLGYSNVFVKQNVGGITDDHRFVNEIAKIPMVDIVHYDPTLGFFGDYHHSRKDNMQIISKETLQVVGTTLLNVLYYE
jgi:glutaminyl-peptide cyclotransferase